MRDIVVRSRVNVGDMENVNVGAGEVCIGGVMVTCRVLGNPDALQGQQVTHRRFEK